MCTQTQTSFDASSDAASSSQHETEGSFEGSPACHCGAGGGKVSVCCEEVVVAVARGGRKRAGNERTAAWAAAVANLHACAGVRRYVSRLARHGDRGGVRRATSCDGCTHGAHGHVGGRESENAEHFVGTGTPTSCD